MTTQSCPDCYTAGDGDCQMCHGAGKIRSEDALESPLLKCPAQDARGVAHVPRAAALVSSKRAVRASERTKDCSAIRSTLVPMLIGEKLKQLREAKSLSQGDIEKRTGLLRCYTSRVENGHTVPSVDTLEKYTGALNVPLYRLFYEGENPPKHVTPAAADQEKTQVKGMVPLAKALARLDEQDRGLLLAMANKMAGRHMRKSRTARK